MRARLVVLVALLAAGGRSAAARRRKRRLHSERHDRRGALPRQRRDSVAVASITKLMTALVTLQHTRLDDVVVAQPEAASVGESTIDLQAGERLTVHELLEASLIQSANDATWALAEHVGGGDVTASSR